MAKTRTLFVAVLVALVFAGTVKAQSVTITSTGYIAANSPYPASTQPGGTFNLPGKPSNYGDHRVVCDYGVKVNGTYQPYSTSPNPGIGNTSVMASQVFQPGMGGTFNWGMPGKSTWTSPAPTNGDWCRARLQKRVSNTGNDLVDWVDVTETTKLVI